MNSADKRIIKQYSEAASSFAAVAYVEKDKIIAPALIKNHEKVARATNFNPDKDKGLEFGCAAGLLVLPFLRDGIHVDSVEITPAMRSRAERAISKAKLPKSIRRKDVKIVASASQLEEGAYKFAMMNFVHQCCSSERSLKKMFNEVANLLQDNGQLILTTTHQDFLHIPHAMYSCDVKDSTKLRDGDRFGGTIYAPRPDEEDLALELGGDYFWSHETLLRVAKAAGFEQVRVEDIEDQSFLSRKASKDPAYRMVTWRKKPVEKASPAAPSVCA